jgi:hypothetical protein
MKDKKDRGKRRKLPRRSLPQSLKEVVQMWETARGVKVPETFDELMKSGDEWKEDGFDEQASDDWKTSEGTSLFVTKGNSCEVWLELPFTTVRSYGKPLINHVTFFDGDKKRIAFLDFKDGKAITAGTFNEKGQTVDFPTDNAANKK